MSENKKILIIDDEEIIVDILKRRFERMGFNVLFAFDGSQAVNTLKSEKIDIVICDVKMPNGTSGEDVLKISKETNPDSRFVAISGHILNDESVQAIMKNGAAMFVKKPFPSLSDVTQQIANLLS